MRVILFLCLFFFLGNTTVATSEKAKEDDKFVIYIEGRSDKQICEYAYDKFYGHIFRTLSKLESYKNMSVKEFWEKKDEFVKLIGNGHPIHTYPLYGKFKEYNDKKESLDEWKKWSKSKKSDEECLKDYTDGCFDLDFRVLEGLRKDHTLVVSGKITKSILLRLCRVGRDEDKVTHIYIVARGTKFRVPFVYNIYSMYDSKKSIDDGFYFRLSIGV